MPKNADSVADMLKGTIDKPEDKDEGYVVEAAIRLTGSAQADYTMTLMPRVTLTGHAGRDPIDATFAPELPFDLGDLRLQPNLRGSGQGVGPFAPRETASGTHVAAGQLELGPLSLSVRTARPLSLIGLVASLLLGALALAALLQRHRGEEHERIAARYGHLLLPVRSRPQEWARVTDLADIGSLVRAAEQYDRMIFHVNDGGEHSYLVESEGSVLRYRTKTAPTHTGPPFPSLRIEDAEAVQAAPPALVPGGQVAKRHRPRRRFSRRRDSEDW